MTVCDMLSRFAEIHWSNGSGNERFITFTHPTLNDRCHGYRNWRSDAHRRDWRWLDRKDHWPLVEFGCLSRNMSTCLVPPHMLFAWGPHFMGVCGHSERKSSSMPGESVFILRRNSSWRALAQKLQECRHAGHLHSIPWGRWKSRRWWRWGGFTKNTCQKFGQVLSERWLLHRRPEMESSQDWELMSGMLP